MREKTIESMGDGQNVPYANSMSEGRLEGIQANHHLGSGSWVGLRGPSQPQKTSRRHTQETGEQNDRGKGGKWTGVRQSGACGGDLSAISKMPERREVMVWGTTCLGMQRGLRGQNKEGKKKEKTARAPTVDAKHINIIELQRKCERPYPRGFVAAKKQEKKSEGTTLPKREDKALSVPGVWHKKTRATCRLDKNKYPVL